MQTVKIMEETLKTESNEVIMYLAMSRIADSEGHGEVAQYLRKVAMDEAMHASEFAQLLGLLKDTKSNLEMMLNNEMRTEQNKSEAAQIALVEGYQDAHRIFERTMRDETGHKEGLKKALSRLHGKD